MSELEKEREERGLTMPVAVPHSVLIGVVAIVASPRLIIDISIHFNHRNRRSPPKAPPTPRHAGPSALPILVTSP